jgi:hypothetical protein
MVLNPRVEPWTQVSDAEHPLDLQIIDYKLNNANDDEKGGSGGSL